jgi:hypothetical protein
VTAHGGDPNEGETMASKKATTKRKKAKKLQHTKPLLRKAGGNI